jgi:signal transduction histidine kinase
VGDAAIAAVVALNELPSAYGEAREAGAGPVVVVATVAVAAAQCLALLARRERPLAVLVAVASGSLVLLAAGTQPERDYSIPVLLALLTVGAWSAGRVTLPVVAAVVTVLAAVPLAGGATGAGIGYAVLAALVLLGGRALRRAREHTAALRTRAATLEADRLRLARDLHDAVASPMAAVMAAAGGPHGTVSPEDAGRRLAAVGSSAREGLAEMHRIVDGLRGEPGAAPGPRGPGIADIPALVERMRVAMAVSLVVDDRREDRCGDRAEPVPGDVQAVAYATVREGLANAARHAAGAVVGVTVRLVDRCLEVTVVDDGRGTGDRASPDGAGLTGLRERVAEVSGAMTAGPSEGAGYRLRVLLPLPGADPA